MWIRKIPLIVSVGVLMAGVGLTQAQPRASSPALDRVRPGEPVDQTVGDLGPHDLSLRRVEPGLGAFSDATNLYRRFEPATWQQQDGAQSNTSGLHLPQSYIYRAPGVRAYVDRPQYFTAQGRNVPVEQGPEDDPRFQQIITSNTVFDLIPGDGSPVRPQQRDGSASQVRLNGIGEQHRIDGRVGGAVEGQVRGQLGSQVGASSARPHQAAIQAQQRRARAIATARRDREGASAPRRGDVPTSTDASLPDRFGPNHPAREAARQPARKQAATTQPAEPVERPD